MEVFDFESLNLEIKVIESNNQNNGKHKKSVLRPTNGVRYISTLMN